MGPVGRKVQAFKWIGWKVAHLNLQHQGGKRDARQAPADEYKEPEANYEAPADSYQEPDPSYSVPTVPPVNTGYVNPQAPTDKPVSL